MMITRSVVLDLPAGRFFERACDGREVDLGRVREWTPPERIVLDFYVGTDADHPTEVIVSFRPEGPGTRVTVEHRPRPVSEEMWSTRAPQFEKSWDALLAALTGYRPSS